MRPLTSLFVAALSFAAVAGSAAAAPLTVPIDQSVRVDVGGLVNSIVIANPGVVDVRVVDSHTFYLLGNGYGSTNVVALDREGRTVYTADVVVASPTAGQVSVYRGGARTDMACAGSCQVSIRSSGGGGAGGGGGGSGGSGGGGGGSSGGGGPLGAVASALGGTP